MRALVMGGNRYIGLNLLFELARQGHEVTVMNSHLAEMPDGCRRLVGDRKVPGAIADVLGPHRDEFDVVFDNTSFTLDDLVPMIELFHGRVEHYVFTSSTAVYRRSFVQPVDESFRTHDAGDEDPRKAYGVNKVRCEQHLRRLFEETGFPATSLRGSHTLVPRSPLVGRDPIFFARLEAGRPILVPGEGFSAMSLIHVHDVARLMVSVLGNDAAPGAIYNVASPEFTTILGAVHLMARAAGVSADVVHVPVDVARRASRPLVHWGEALVGSMVVSVEAARRDLGWSPSVSLADGYRDSYEWWRDGGRERYEYDFAPDDEVLALLGR